jgi:MoaA/NifB/PqqE/SkfB family radical SAM enzyme
MTIDDIHREQAAWEKRHWVRLTLACNNRCLFCLDSGLHTGQMLDLDDLREDLRRGIAGGAERLILSGGEPTIHPNYLDLIGFGRELGYKWIQTVTNGRMFAYRKFAHQAVRAGLNEATFSMHGHNPALHDRLVGVEGAFRQSLQGMENLMAEGAVVNVDVVVNAINLEVLPDILDFYMERGITEFDLLWPVPFGRAWENRAEIIHRPDSPAPQLREAVNRARSRGAVVWTNRLPPSLLEGLEDLIQDPHKLHDEVKGRRHELELSMSSGHDLPCKDPRRCPLCFLAGFCTELERLQDKGTSFPPASRKASGDPRKLDDLLKQPGGDIEVILNRDSAQWLLENAAAVRGQASRVVFSLETFLSLSDAEKRGVNPVEALETMSGTTVRILNLPTCVLPDAEVVVEDARPGSDALSDLVDHYILHGYRVFSLRCRGCAHREGCPGLPINHVRRFGFKLANPMGSGDSGEELCAVGLEGEGKAHLVIRTKCLNACTFCTTRIINLGNRAPWALDDLPKIERTLRMLREKDCTRLRFAAIEPLEHPDITGIIKRARELGFAEIEVWSHGGPLADMTLARRVVEAGLTLLDVPVFGPDAEIHDRIAGRAGAFEETRRGLANLREMGFDRINAHMVVSRGNHTHIAATLQYCKSSEFGPVQSIVLAAPSSPDPEVFRPVAVPLTETVEALQASRGEVDPGIFNRVLRSLSEVFPHCLLVERFPDSRKLLSRTAAPAPLEDSSRVKIYKGSLKGEGEKTIGADLKQRARCPHADSCALGATCPGIYPFYLELYGDGELIPQSS